MAMKKPKNQDLWIWGVVAVIVLVLIVSLSNSRNEEEIIVPEPVKEVVEEVIEVVEPVEEPEEVPQPNPKITKYFRLENVKSYSFIPAIYYLNRGLSDTDVRGTYEIRGGKARAETVPLLGMDGWSADYVYIDFEEESATGYCLELPACINDGLKGDVPFSDYDIPLPDSWVDAIQYGEITGSLTYNDRRAIVVDWESEGLYYQAYVDTFYGVPMRIIGTSDEKHANIVTGIDYRGIALNSVSDEVVTPPY